MTFTSHQEFNDATEALEVAQAFAEHVRGKTALITGVNLKGIGFATAEALVGLHPKLKKHQADSSYRPLSLRLSLFLLVAILRR